MTRLVASLADLAGRYDAAFVDLWGCVHDGLAAFPEAVAALRAFRGAGGRVVLLTNAPRPRRSVEAQIERLGVPPDAWDAVATSGDAARVALFEGQVGRRVWFMGQAIDLSFLEAPRIVADPVAVERAPLAEAEGIACCGPFDPHADPEVNRPAFEAAIARGLRLLCANPDIVVDRGETREWCAGALAALYEGMGGEALYFGKPHAPIYDLARLRLAEAGGPDAPAVPDDRIVAIGDGPATDIRGALDQGLDCVLVTGGLAAAETATAPGGQPDEARLIAHLADLGMAPTWAMGFLR